MKKQKRVLASVTVAIMVILIGYYLAPLVSGYSRATFEVVTTAGDETLMDDVYFFGGVNKGYDFENVVVTNEETHYEYSASNLSSYVGLEVKVGHLIDRYPSFVRGKSTVAENFSETEEMIAYVENYARGYYNDLPVSETQLEISVFDKETGEEKENKITIKAEQPFNFVHVYSLIMHGDYLILDVSVDWLDDQMQTIVYDWKVGETINTFEKSFILQAMDYSHYFGNFSITNENDTLLVREMNLFEIGNGELDYQYAYSLFNLKDGTRQEIKLSEAFYQEDNLFYASKEGAFTINQIDGQLVIEKYDLTKQSVAWQEVLPLKIDALNSDSHSFSLLEKDGALLLTESYMNNAQDTLQFVFINLGDFGILAEGYVEMKDADNTANAYFDAITHIE